MKAEFVQRGQHLSIRITDVCERENLLLEALGKCRSGVCACPMAGRAVVEGMVLQRLADGVEIELDMKSGAAFNSESITRCLECRMGARERSKTK
jgi:hypothetical protein